MIVLLSDFGGSQYTGMMKGVIHTICTQAEIVDLTHDITPHSVREGAWVLLNAYRYFPPRSIFVCVVDPGVGTDRDAVLVKTTNYVFIGPDNGLMYPAAHSDVITQVFPIIVEDVPSNTFHGRDVFARMGAYLEKGLAGRHLGPLKDDFSVPLEFHLEGRTGEVTQIDRFGNIVTNLPPTEKENMRLSAAGIDRELEWVRTFEKGPDDNIFLITGSCNTLEICAKRDRASEFLDLAVGDRVTIE